MGFVSANYAKGWGRVCRRFGCTIRNCPDCCGINPLEKNLSKIILYIGQRISQMPTLEKAAEMMDKGEYWLVVRPGVNILEVSDERLLIRHDFEKLNGLKFANKGWEQYQIAQATQDIQFSLLRGGVILESQSVLVVPGCGAAAEFKPMHWILNKPFLI